MSFGFLGIQFGFTLQGFMTRIFQTLGADKSEIPLLWIHTTPLTGLVVQPIIGYMSDRTWSKRWGKKEGLIF